MAFTSNDLFNLFKQILDDGLKDRENYEWDINDNAYIFSRHFLIAFGIKDVMISYPPMVWQSIRELINKCEQPSAYILEESDFDEIAKGIQTYIDYLIIKNDLPQNVETSLYIQFENTCILLNQLKKKLLNI
jgi:hypothetical protein